MIFIFRFCRATIRVAVLLDFGTISSCWTGYGSVFFCIFNLTEQWESPCYQTIKQYHAAGLGMLLIFIFFFLSRHYQSRRVFRIGNNIMLLDLVWYWFFSAFNLPELWESPCCQTIKQYHVAGLGMLLIFIFHFCHATIRVAVLLELETISCCWTWYGTDIYFPFLSRHYQSRRVIRIGNNIMFLDLVWYWFFSAFLTSPSNESRLVVRH